MRGLGSGQKVVVGSDRPSQADLGTSHMGCFRLWEVIGFSEMFSFSLDKSLRGRLVGQAGGAWSWFLVWFLSSGEVMRGLGSGQKVVVGSDRPSQADMGTSHIGCVRLWEVRGCSEMFHFGLINHLGGRIWEEGRGQILSNILRFHKLVDYVSSWERPHIHHI